jgi:hypothetical protein
MAQIVAQELYVGPGARPDIETGIYDQIITSSLTLTAASTAVSFDITNMGSGVTFYAVISANFPPGSSSTSYILNIFANPPVGSAGDAGVLLAANAARSTTGVTSIMIGPGLPTTLSTIATTVNKLVPRNLRATLSWSTAAASVNCVMSIGVSFHK